MSLVVSNYLLANIILEAVINKRFAKQELSFRNTSSINSSICGATMDSIFIYFCIVYERFIVFASINFLKIFVDNLVLDNL